MKLSKCYTLLSWSWGLPLNLLGHIIALALIILGYRPRKWGGALYFVVGEGWGGISFGSVMIVAADYDTTYVKNHEFGHAIQNCYLGPLCPFIVNIPSFLRASYRELIVMLGIKKRSELSDYENIWFESQATKFGHEYISYWEDTKNEKLQWHA